MMCAKAPCQEVRQEKEASSPATLLTNRNTLTSVQSSDIDLVSRALSFSIQQLFEPLSHSAYIMYICGLHSRSRFIEKMHLE